MVEGQKRAMKTRGSWKINFTNFQILQMLGRVSRTLLLTAVLNEQQGQRCICPFGQHSEQLSSCKNETHDSDLTKMVATGESLNNTLMQGQPPR